MAAIASDVPATAVGDWWQREGAALVAQRTDDPDVAARSIRSLVGALHLPFPGAGQTRRRFEALATLGELDLTVGRLAEAHTDALAILHELGGAAPPPNSVWAVWAAEPPSARVSAAHSVAGGWRLDGRKAWCSGAGGSSHALVTAHADDGPRLFAVDLKQPGVCPVVDPWPTPALSGTDTRSVDFREARATAVGGPGAYVNRPGFWHGSVGVAAVWCGGAVGVARTLLNCTGRTPLSDINAVHLGAVAAALAGARAVLSVAADSFDADPLNQTGRVVITARSTRAVVEAAVGEVIDRVGRALGAAPLALDGQHARRVADLQLYVRQSHADRDLADLGTHIADAGEF